MVARVLGKGEMRDGLDYMDPRRDMREVVDLLQEAFGAHMDPEGRLVLREMRFFARIAPWLGAWVLGPGVYGSVVVGFVWREQGHVVGHATVQRMDYEGFRWQIANVAVAKPYRGRGIGRALMEAALDHIRRAHGVWAILQVRANNAPAVHLYRSLGFEEVGGESRWSCDLAGARLPLPADFPSPALEPLSYRDAPALRDLQARSFQEAGRWWWGERALRFSHPGVGSWLLRVFGLLTLRRFGYRHGGQLLVRLDVLADRLSAAGEFLVQVDTRYWGRWEEALVVRAMREASRLGVRRLTARVDLEHEALLRALERMGFREELRLLNMRRRIERERT